ncbi:hypothetical protein F4679DRAFT_534104 [Xylaria curta]|nr:hypothetical protein F4679DRAFT_534104 [Xylaria curta]
MAPTSKGTNPAPNYTVAMNRVQTQIEAQLRIVRSFMPSRTPAQQSVTTSSAKPSFSALASTSTSTPSTFQSRQQTQKQDSESLFTETRAQDPNAGLGFGGPSKRNSEKEKERENQILRSRLLGRKRGAENASGRTSRREESSDEEPGRSGLGRAKKRARREVLKEEEKGGEEIVSPGAELEASEPAGSLEKVAAAESEDNDLNNGKPEEEDDGDVDMRDGQEPTFRDDSVPNDAEGTSEQKKSKKRKKKRKKNKSKETGGG